MPEPAVRGAHPGRLGPTERGGRIVALDVLRGFALLGILFVNVMGVSGVLAQAAGGGGLADRTVELLLDYGARGVFLSTFAMLFGIGFALQIARIGSAGDLRGLTLYLRRMTVLLLFGLVHTLLEPGEVLVQYALCGTLLIPFRKVSSRGIALAALILIPLPFFHTAVESARSASEPVIEETSTAEDPFAWNPYRSAESIRVHADGSFSDVVRFNTRFTINRLTPSVTNYVWLTVPLPLMLLGMIVGRLGILADIQVSRPWILRTLWAGIVVAVSGRLVGSMLFDLAERVGWNPWVAMGGNVGWYFGTYSLAVAYSAALLLLLQREPWRRILLPLSFVGRMALTNYLLQTVICTSLFYQYGFGLFGDVSGSAAASVAVGIFGCQVAVSALWLTRYRFGPAEWIWRSLSYGVVLANRCRPSLVPPK